MSLEMINPKQGTTTMSETSGLGTRSIRPSRLPLAQHCGYSVTLAEQFPESSAAAERGTRYHEEFAAYIQTGVGSTQHASIFATFPAHEKAEAEVVATLRDSDTGEIISAGTLDVVLTHADGSICVIDHKTGQPDKVDDVDENLQLAVYGLAMALDRGAHKYRVGISFPGLPLRLSRWFHDGCFHDGDDYWDVLSRIKAAMLQPRNEPKTGDHCNRCYSRKHCHAWALVAAGAEGELANTVPADLVDDAKIANVLLGITALEERIKVMKAHIYDRARAKPIEHNGKRFGPVLCSGRRTVSIEALEEVGLADAADRLGAIKPGKPYERFSWTNATSTKRIAKGGASDWQSEDK